MIDLTHKKVSRYLQQLDKATAIKPCLQGQQTPNKLAALEYIYTLSDFD